MSEMKFKVLAGQHRDGDKTYKKGQVFTSRHDLVKMFRGKFMRVGGVEEAEIVPDEDVTADTEIEKASPPEAGTPTPKPQSPPAGKATAKPKTAKVKTAAKAAAKPIESEDDWAKDRAPKA